MFKRKSFKIRIFLSGFLALAGFWNIFFGVSLAAELSFADLINSYKSYVLKPTAAPPVPAKSITAAPVNAATGAPQVITLQGPPGPPGPRGPAGSSNSVDPSLFVSQSAFDRKIQAILDSIDNGADSVSNSVGERVDTDLLNVSGNASVVGNFSITGDITGGNFTWNETNDRLGIGTTSPLTTLDLAGDFRSTGKANSTLTGSIDTTA